MSKHDPSTWPPGVFPYYEVYENEDKTEGRGKSWLVCRTRDHGHAERMARKRGPMGTDESVRTYYAIELGGKVWNLGYSIPEELKIPTKDEELEIERALKKLTERERKLLKIDL